ncbi:transcriptional regulator [Pseudomonas aeruginosa]|uniref:transcriptional regulator n=3 Tax=Pseudomonas aeruginosa TaxID=287 RepID=UPI0029C01E07|nr:YdaS family helix-turn-helix protein [Pseudomonas aeruginosa]
MSLRRMFMASSPLEKAILAVGSAKALAQKVGVTPMAVTQWKVRGVPANRVHSIVAACAGAVSAEELRPDLFKAA